MEISVKRNLTAMSSTLSPKVNINGRYFYVQKYFGDKMR